MPDAPTNPPEPPSPWAFRFATVSGIPLRIHFTFLLFLAWIVVVGRARENFLWPVFIVAVFACVLLHELGHAWAAKRAGIATKSITLYPIGGLALLDGRPNARQEIGIALAGPAVNVVIAAVLAAAIFLRDGRIVLDAGLTRETFLTALLGANLTLAIFNLIPAFPMDGGRVLRAWIALHRDEVTATKIAAGVGQTLAIAIGLWGLLNGQAILVLVAFFVFLGAGQELTGTVARSLLAGHRVRDAMQVRFRTLRSGDTMETAAEYLLAGSQHDFPVVVGEEVVGILTRAGIAQGLAAPDGASRYVSEAMRRDVRFAQAGDDLEPVAERVMERGDAMPALVMEDERLVGMLTPENLSEFLMLENARRQGRTARA